MFLQHLCDLSNLFPLLPPSPPLSPIPSSLFSNPSSLFSNPSSLFYSSTLLNALYVFCLVATYGLLLLFIGRPILTRYMNRAARTESETLQSSLLALTFMAIFLSAFFTVIVEGSKGEKEEEWNLCIRVAFIYNMLICSLTSTYSLYLSLSSQGHRRGAHHIWRLSPGTDFPSA